LGSSSEALSPISCSNWADLSFAPAVNSGVKVDPMTNSLAEGVLSQIRK
jgi:hypothetical protein